MVRPKPASLGKTTRPSLSGVLPRKRLFDLLDQGRAGPAVWVTGPPGCGKTSLVASYLDRVRIASLWYQLDEGDADVATFFYYLRTAADDIWPDEADPLPLLSPAYHAGLPVFARRYFQALYGRLERPFAIVFDGWHEVPASSHLDDVLRIAVEELPPGGCAILLSRGDPPAALARLRANRVLATIGWEDLRLLRQEAADIATERRPGMTAKAIDDVYAHTQGWAAGLILMLEQARLAGPIGDPLDFSSGRLVFDYLAGEILQKSDPATQEFLLKTSYLTQMTATIARAATQNERAGEILGELHRNNYFVTLKQALPDALYQYHPMFREFLQARAQGVHSKDMRRQLQKSSAALLETAGNPEDAFGLYRDSHDWDEMARLIGAHAEGMLDNGRGETLRHWVEDLPPELASRYPWTAYWAAATRAQVAPREARLLYERAFDLFRGRSEPDIRGIVLSCSGAMDAILYELDDFSLLDRWIATLDEAVKSGAVFPSPAVEARVACSMVFSLTLRQPHRRDIETWLERALACARQVQDPNLQMFVGLLCALTLMWTGLFSKAAELIGAMRRRETSDAVTPFTRITLKNVEAMYYMLTAQYEPCVKAARDGLDLARSTGIDTWSFQLRVYAYGGSLGAGKLDRAARLAREMEPHAALAGRFNLCMYHHFRAWEAMLRKDPMRALQEERSALRYAVEVGCPYFEALCRLALARVLFECGDQRKCVVHLRQVRAVVREIANRHLEFTCLLGFAEMALAYGRHRPGLRALRTGLAIGREYGYEHFLWWWPAAMSRICARALEEGIEVDYVRSLVRRRGLIAERPALGESWPWTFRVHVLGNFVLLKHDEPLRSAGKAQRRPMELLKALIAMGGEQVGEGRVADALWPRIDGDSARRSLTSTLHRLRKLLGEDRAIVLHEGKLSLDRRFFWVDAWAFERLVAEIEKGAAGDAEASAERLFALYRGALMADEEDASWCIQARERERSRFARALARLSAGLAEPERAERARIWQERWLEIDPQAVSMSKASVSNR